MKSSIAALVAIAATAMASGNVVCENCGGVEIVSHCNEEIYFQNVPAMGETIGSTCLTAGSTYSQAFTALPNLAGWSMKLSPDPSFPSDNTQQYEYTWQGGSNPVWYDMSYVNGAPYENVWNFTSSNVELCDPNGQAYRNATDDAYGMQTSCPTDVTLTLHLCPQNAGAALSSASASESAVAATGTPATSTVSYSQPATIGAIVVTSSSVSSVSSAAYTPASSSKTTLQTSTTSSSPESAYTGSWNNENKANHVGSVVASPSTTQVVATSVAENGAVVTETQVQVVTQVQTYVVTARDAAPSEPAHKRRHEHRHPHGSRA